MTHSGIWLIITRNTSHSKFTRRLLCYLRTSFLEEIFNGDLLLGFTWLAEFNYFSSSLYWEWMTLSRHYKYINTKFSDTNICRFRKKTLFQVPRYVNAAPLRGFDFNRRITISILLPRYAEFHCITISIIWTTILYNKSYTSLLFVNNDPRGWWVTYSFFTLMVATDIESWVNGMITGCRISAVHASKSG